MSLDFSLWNPNPHTQIMRFCQSFMNELYRYLGPDKVLSGGLIPKYIEGFLNDIIGYLTTFS